MVEETEKGEREGTRGRKNEGQLSWKIAKKPPKILASDYRYFSWKLSEAARSPRIKRAL